jgi:hypothetical protein
MISSKVYNMINETVRVLCAIGSTDRVYADEFLRNLRDPIPFPELFALIKTLEEQRLVTTVRSGHDGIISLNLTELGAERAREAAAYAKHGGCACMGHSECDFCKDRKLPPRKPNFKSGLVIDA